MRSKRDMKPDDRLPTILEGGINPGDPVVVAVKILLHRCDFCGHIMASKFDYWAMGIEQARHLDVIMEDFEEEVDGVTKYGCTKCKEDNRHTFKCYLCEKQRPYEDVQYRVGDPEDRMCKTCYNTVPASTWQKAHDELYEAHRWDYD